MTAVKKFNISHISQHLKLLTNFCPNIVIIGVQSSQARFKLIYIIKRKIVRSKIIYTILHIM